MTSQGQFILNNNEPVLERAARMVDAFVEMEAGDSIIIHGGIAFDHNDGKQPAIIIDLHGSQFCFTSKQAQQVARTIQMLLEHHETVCDAPNCVIRTFPQLITALENACIEADQNFRKSQLQ